MIAGIEGIVEGFGNDYILIKVGGIYFHVLVASPASHGSIGERIHLHTSLKLRENFIAIYGFSSQEELELFETLISVSGVGPKAALAMLAAIPLTKLVLSIMSGDITTLMQIPGVGKKMASRLILELKGKLDRWHIDADVSSIIAPDGEVMAALKSLGYTTAEATAAIAAIPASTDLGLEDKIKISLQHLGNA